MGMSSMQVGFIDSLPGAMSNFDLVILFLLVLLMIYDVSLAFYFGLLIGYLLDISSFSGFGLHMFSLQLVLAVSFLLLSRVLTNRSLYSFLMLVLIASIVNWLSLRLGDLFLFGMLGFERNYFFNSAAWKNFAWKIGLNMVFGTIAFQSAMFVSKKLRPVFLDKKII